VAIWMVSWCFNAQNNTHSNCSVLPSTSVVMTLRFLLNIKEHINVGANVNGDEYDYPRIAMTDIVFRQLGHLELEAQEDTHARITSSPT
jgi:hypothetical protein